MSVGLPPRPRCLSCDRLAFPGRMLCLDCNRHDPEWEPKTEWGKARKRAREREAPESEVDVRRSP